MPYFNYLTLLFPNVMTTVFRRKATDMGMSTYYFDLDCLKSPQSYTSLITEHFLRANLNMKGEIIGNSTYFPKDLTLKSKLSVIGDFKMIIIMRLTCEPILCVINSSAMHILDTHVKQPIKTYFVFPTVLVLQ